jgi:hypothetical protein
MSNVSLSLGHFPDGVREPDAIEFAVMTWLDNNDLDLIANDLHACIEGRFEKISKADFIHYSTNYVRSSMHMQKDAALSQLRILYDHWFSFLKLYTE